MFPYLLGWVVGFMIFTAIQPLVPLLAEDQLGLTNKQDITDVVGLSLLSMGLVNIIVLVTLMQKIKLAPPVILRGAFILFGLVSIAANPGNQYLDVLSGIRWYGVCIQYGCADTKLRSKLGG